MSGGGNQLHNQAKKEYEEAKNLFATNLEKDVDEFKDTITANVKAWKASFRKARDLTALRREARRFSCNIVPMDEGSTIAEKTLFKTYALTPLKVDGRDLSAEPSTPQDTPHITPPNLPSSLPDPNVTPTPVRTKRHRIEEPAPYPPLSESLFLPVTTPAETPAATNIPLPEPMEEDLEYALEVATDHLHANGEGIYASVHAALPHPSPPIPVHSPSAPPLSHARVAQTEQRREDPPPAALTAQPARLEVPPQAPPAAAGGDLAAVLAAINATIQGLESRITDRLDAQDKRIQALTILSRPDKPSPSLPAVAAKRAKGQTAVAAAPTPNTRSSPSDASETVVPVPRVDDPASHDRAEEIYTPGALESDQAPDAARTTILREAFQPPPEKHVRLNVDSQGKPTPATSMPPSWANVVTKQASGQHAQGQQQAKAVTTGTYRSATGKARPETVQRRKQTGNTEATVIRHHGLEDISFELTIRKMTPAAIIAETRTEVDRLSGGKIVLLSGRWSSNPNKTIHNFMYTFKGQVPFKALYPLRDVLVKPLMTGQLVPNDGWTFTQIRDTNTAGHDGTVYTSQQLEDELRRNPAFEEAIFCIAPHWQGTMHKVSMNPKGTVKFAYVDEDGRITAQAKRDGIFLFNERARFVPTGDVASILLCGRCHRISHATDSTACPLPANGVRCFICGEAHHSNDHATHCPNQHDKVGECRCLFPCINCGGGHNARSPHCKLKMGFAPSPLALPPTTTAAPAAPSAKGKAKATGPELLVPTQREQEPTRAPEESEGPFIPVRKKQGRRARNTVAKVQAKASANAAVPGSSSASTSAPAQPPVPAKPPTPTASGSGKKTSTVPARPIYKPPTPPTWHEVPVIHKRHVANDIECAQAMHRVFRREPTVEDLRSLHVAWGGNKNDEEVTALWTLQFRWAVKYGLPLTINGAKRRILEESPLGEEETLKRFKEDHGTVGPLNYLYTTIPREQYFSRPGDIEEVEIPAETKEHNRNMARTLVNTIIQFKQLEAKTNNTPPPPTIPAHVIEGLLNIYSHNGTYSFFGLASAGADDSIWNALLDSHAQATSDISSYA
ncbi:hypothetical protein EDB86DRAFT_3083781 [Lactarius hatsudake]|nr:hypothetical protein EDB86DRAFT_3083781 [Lactarius hatsudake]